MSGYSRHDAEGESGLGERSTEKAWTPLMAAGVTDTIVSGVGLRAG